MSDSQQGPQGGVVPHLALDGAGEASAFYQRAFGATELFRMPAPDGKRLMHCHLKINGGSLMICDCFPEHGGSAWQPSKSYTLHLQVDHVETWFSRAVEAGCTVSMAPADMFWGDRYGQVTDPFGVKWALASPIKKG